MKLPNTSIAFLLSMSLLATCAYADLDNPTYARARGEFARNNCYEALPLLKKYKKEDDRFLAENPEIAATITDAIDYCQDVLFPGLHGYTFPTTPSQKPELPANMAHAFDTKARLVTVIAELKSGNPKYEQMEPMLRIVVRRQIAAWGARLQALGPLQSVSFEGEQDGADVYEVKFANGSTAWMIGIAPNGNIAALVFQ